jgi:myo-inositol catabolism protein IolC
MCGVLLSMSASEAVVTRWLAVPVSRRLKFDHQNGDQNLGSDCYVEPLRLSMQAVHEYHPEYDAMCLEGLVARTNQLGAAHQETASRLQCLLCYVLLLG